MLLISLILLFLLTCAILMCLCRASGSYDRERNDKDQEEFLRNWSLRRDMNI